MVAHGQNLPKARTESAKEARRNFYCELCNKEYDRYEHLDRHMDSKDHLHKQRENENRIAMRNSRNEEMRKRKPPPSDMGMFKITKPPKPSIPSKKVAGFVKVGSYPAELAAADAVKEAGARGDVEALMRAKAAGATENAAESVGEVKDDDDEYDPAFPTACDEECPMCLGRLEQVAYPVTA